MNYIHMMQHCLEKLKLQRMLPLDTNLLLTVKSIKIKVFIDCNFISTGQLDNVQSVNQSPGLNLPLMSEILVLLRKYDPINFQSSPLANLNFVFAFQYLPYTVVLMHIYGNNKLNCHNDSTPCGKVLKLLACYSMRKEVWNIGDIK